MIGESGSLGGLLVVVEWSEIVMKKNTIEYELQGSSWYFNESSIVCVQQLLPNQSRGNANFYALYDHEASLPKCFLAHYMVITVGCEWSPCLFLLIIFIKINMVLIYIGFSWWTFGASPKFCSHDWRKCRHILCDEKDTRARGHPGQVRLSNFIFVGTFQGLIIGIISLMSDMCFSLTNAKMFLLVIIQWMVLIIQLQVSGC